MCGFLGCSVKDEINIDVIDECLELIAHRGPDHCGFVKSSINNSFVYLGHSRLSIIDLSDAASQPFTSDCNQYSVVFNGEIYNYKELRNELEALGHSFNTSSDTEVLLIAFIEWGVACLNKLVGMFAFVFLDKRKNSLTLVRDAFGIKPLFYSLKENEIYFSSELMPVLKLKRDEVKPNLQQSYNYLVHGEYDSSECTFVEGVFHLPPACYMHFDLNSCEASIPTKWWVPDINTNHKITFEDAVHRLRSLFLESIQLHLRSDVPIGVTLSGGIDSSAIVSAVRHLDPQVELKTFSYIATDKTISEEKWIDVLSENLNFDSHKVFAKESELCEHLDSMIEKQGEPFSSTSIYAQYRVFELVKSHQVKVTLDGQGADELLAGYSGYPGHRLLSILESDGFLSAHKFACEWSKYPGRNYFLAWQYFFRIICPDGIYKFIRKFLGKNFEPKWLNIQFLKNRGVKFSENRSVLLKKNKSLRVKEELANSLMFRGLPSLLRHGDRNSMAFSVESRVPFLTIPVAEFLLSLPENFLVSNGGVTKHVFREAMKGIVPDVVLSRSDKIGFQAPESLWLLSIHGQIRNWIETAPNIDFINKKELLEEFSDIVSRKKPYDGKVWRWINYFRWCKVVGIK